MPDPTRPLVASRVLACFGYAAALMLLVSPARAANGSSSIYGDRPDDPAAVTVTRDAFGAAADGVADDTAALQAAIDRVQETTRRGVVLLPEGRYRLSRPLLVWSGIRLIGFGASRPVLVLGPSTPGYQTGDGRYLVHFVAERPARADEPVRDANPGTFYSAMANIDIEIGSGNPAAVGVRSHFAQHGYLAHMDFRIGEGRAGVEEVGNQFEHLRFFGGEYGIIMHKPSPSWPFALLDSEFAGQRRAAIETEEGGLTLIRTWIHDTPSAVVVRPDRSEELYVHDSRFERLAGPALVISDETSARTQINLRNVVCVDVPLLALFRESGRTVAGTAPIFRVTDFSHGLQLTGLGATPSIGTDFDHEVLATAPEHVPTDLAPLPPTADWVNVRSLGAVGDGATDDTDALRAAVAAHRTLFFPAGFYRVTDTITLRPDSVLVGLHPSTTRLVIADYTPAFQGPNGPTERPVEPDLPGVPRAWRRIPPFTGKGAPKAMVEAPRGGTTILTGLGLDTGGINNRAVALKWCAGERSLVNDVRFHGGHGTYDAAGRYPEIYNDTRTGDPDPARRWDSQFWSLWVTDGGGGVFKGIWTPSPFAAAGMYVSDTSTPGRVYALSSEHHVRTEVMLRRTANWQFFALQTEEERGESGHALPLEIIDCRDLLIANFFIYRVDMPTPFPAGIRTTRSADVEFRGVHVYSPGQLSFDNTLIDQTSGLEVRSREIARMRVTSPPPSAPWPADSTGSRVKRVASGFTHATGLAAGPDGTVYLVDPHPGRIFSWSPLAGLTLETDAIADPVAVAVDASGALLIVARHGNVYTFKPGDSEATIRALDPVGTEPRAGATAWLPTNRWRDGHDWRAVSTRREPLHYAASDGSVFLPAPESFPRLTRPRGGWGAGTIDLARTYQLGPARPGHRFYAADEFGQTTWSFSVQPDGALADAELFAEEGEAGVTSDDAGHVYICAGHVFVYDAAGRQIDRIEVPERPSAVVLAGPDRRTLVIAARTSLYITRR